MKDRIKAALDARNDHSFVVMARSDALSVENEDRLIERIQSYIEIGADMIFPEAITSLGQYKKIADASSVPILANITEFGKTPLFSKMDLHKNGVSMILYPLSAFRAMSKAAEEVYNEIINSGTQEGVIEKMQTRDELYKVLDYHSFEKKLDELFKQ